MIAGNLLEGEEMARLQSTVSTRLKVGCKPKSQEWRFIYDFGGCSEASGLTLTDLNLGLFCRAWSW